MTTSKQIIVCSLEIRGLFSHLDKSGLQYTSRDLHASQYYSVDGDPVCGTPLEDVRLCIDLDPHRPRLTISAEDCGNVNPRRSLDFWARSGNLLCASFKRGEHGHPPMFVFHYLGKYGNARVHLTRGQIHFPHTAITTFFGKMIGDAEIVVLVPNENLEELCETLEHLAACCKHAYEEGLKGAVDYDWAEP